MTRLRLTDYAKQTFSPAVLLTGLKEVLGSAPFMDSITEMGKRLGRDEEEMI